MNHEPRKIRLTAKAWQSYTGTLGHNIRFEDGVSVDPVDMRNIRRIGASTSIADVETGQELGPGAEIVRNRLATTKPDPLPKPKTAEQKQEDEDERERLAKEESARKHQEAIDLAAAKEREKQAKTGDTPIYTRDELEAVGANDGIQGLREIAEPYDVKSASITGLIDKILEAQAE